VLALGLHSFCKSKVVARARYPASLKSSQKGGSTKISWFLQLNLLPTTFFFLFLFISLSPAATTLATIATDWQRTKIFKRKQKKNYIQLDIDFF
jgi:hypothetical protein